MIRHRILFAAAELTPLAKVGGIADVVGALPIALTKLGFDVRIILPKYEMIDTASHDFRLTCVLHVPVREGTFPVRVWEGTIPKTTVPVILLENADFLSTGPIYFEQAAAEGGFDEFRRFLFYDLAVAAWIQQSRWQPTVLHCHDWQAGLLPALVGSGLKTVFTIHNIAMQGKWNANDILAFMKRTASDIPALTLRDRHGDMNLAGLGISTADRVTTVSPTYAQEILTPEYGLGLEGLLNTHRKKLIGILNGIDTDRFNPATDPAILPYDAATLDRKAANRDALLAECGLTGRGPVFGFVGRLTDQKGIELVTANAEFFRRHQAQIIILGKGLKRFETEARRMETSLPGQVKAIIDFDAALAQRIYAGADYFLMPSRFEPCGLTQLIALRYGTVPVVRATGGLRDTVRDIEAPDGTGIVFTDYRADALHAALGRAAGLFARPDAYRQVQLRGMGQDFSWRASAGRYAAVYRGLA